MSNAPQPKPEGVNRPKATSAPPPRKNGCNITFDIDRMIQALNSGYISFPTGLTRDKRRAFIRDQLAELNRWRSTDDILSQLPTTLRKSYNLT